MHEPTESLPGAFTKPETSAGSQPTVDLDRVRLGPLNPALVKDLRSRVDVAVAIHSICRGWRENRAEKMKQERLAYVGCEHVTTRCLGSQLRGRRRVDRSKTGPTERAIIQPAH